MRPPNTFDSEIGDVHERGRAPRSTFDGEFRGAPDSVIADERPPDVLAAGRRGRRLVWAIILFVGLLGGAASAVVYFWADISAWVQGLRGGEGEGEVAAAEPSEDAATSTDTGEPEPDLRPLGLPMGNPDEAGDEGEPAPGPDAGGDAASAGADAGPAPAADAGEPEAPEPKPAAGTAKVEVAGTSVRGKVSNAGVSSRLKPVNEAVERCWAEAVKAGSTKPSELKLSFQIKWNRRAQGVSVSGDAPKSVRDCARKALPKGGWPEPRDMGSASVTRRWSLKID